MQDYDYNAPRNLPTFNVSELKDPVENIREAIDYIQERYGDVSNIQTQEEDDPEA